VSSQYRNPLSFTDQVMDASLKALKRMDKVKAGMGAALTAAAAEAAGTPVDGTPSPDDVLTMVQRELDNFDAALLDDLSMPRAAASLFNLIKAAETIMKDAARGAPMDLVGLQAVSDGIDRMDRVFGIFYPLLGETDSVQGEDEEVSNVIPTAVLDLVGQRAAAKDAQEWDLADSLRTRITELGYKVKDVKGGGDPIVSRLE
jgi:cysteinyl-tRNA synthetase